MMLRTISVFAIFLLLMPALRAQVLRGRILHAGTNEVLSGVNVRLQGPGGELSTSSNAEGYRFEALRPGYYQLTAATTGFETQTIAEISIVAGKQNILDISLNPTNSELPTLIIIAQTPGRRPMQPLAEIPLTRDQTLRMPAMFFDPARLAAAYPGVLQTDDGTNNMSVRGSNPAWVRWRLEGLDIVNPNHLPNAGTFSDQPAAAGGGVLLFSAQMLDQSSLITGNYPAEQGDAISGVMDMRLRPGNNQQQEFTAQASLVGLDVAAEGPLRKKSGPLAPSYLANYRYSTVGLLGKMGVSFGDEQINFQDFSLKLHFPGKRGGGWSLFGLGGYSENIFKHRPDTADIDLNKQRFDIDFQSFTTVVGGNGLMRLGDKTWLKMAAAGSLQENERKVKIQVPFYIDDFYNGEYNQYDNKYSFSSSIVHDNTNRLRWSMGVVAVVERFKLYNLLMAKIQQRDIQYIADFSYTTMLSSVNSWLWGKMDWRLNQEKTMLQLSGNLQSYSFYRKFDVKFGNSRLFLNPNILFTQVINQKSRIALSYSTATQRPSLHTFVNHIATNAISNNVIRSKQFGLRYSYFLNPDWILRGELYNHSYHNIPGTYRYMDSVLTSNFNINEFFENIYDTQWNGQARTQGLEISAERYMREGWFAAFNLTLSDSKYRADNGQWLDSRWDVGHLLNLSAGREWQRGDEKQKFFGLNGRVLWSGGLRYMPVDAIASATNILQSTVYNSSEGFSRQLPDYWRMDFRVYWKRNLGNRRNSMFAMDFQNVALRPNIAYYYWEPRTREITAKNQLGLIPNLIWRLEF